MANIHTTLTSLFDDIADSIRDITPVTAQITADAFPAYIKMAGYGGTVPTDPSNLNSCSWDFISWASSEGIANMIWSLGDRKGVSIGVWGGPWGTYQVAAGTYYAYIIGFNHNASLEGNNLTHFEFGFTSASGGAHIAFSNRAYNLYINNSTEVALTRMNKTRTNSGGWASCTMRTGTLNGTSNSLMAAIPSDLKSALKTVKKYTDNVGGGKGNVQSNVTATTDKFFLLNVQELRGTGTMNTYEAEKTQQYQYYKNGNQQIRNKSNETSAAANFALRSPNPTTSDQFLGLSTSGSGLIANADLGLAVSPAFCI